MNAIRNCVMYNGLSTYDMLVRLLGRYVVCQRVDVGTVKSV